MTLLPLHLVVNWPVFTTIFFVYNYFTSPVYNFVQYVLVYLRQPDVEFGQFQTTIKDIFV